MQSSDSIAAAERAILHRCLDAAYVRDARDPMTRLEPRQEAVMRQALDTLIAAGAVGVIEVGSLVVYIAW